MESILSLGLFSMSLTLLISPFYFGYLSLLFAISLSKLGRPHEKNHLPINS